MCLPRICSLILTVCPVAAWILSLDEATDSLKLLTIPFLVSLVAALVYALIAGLLGLSGLSDRMVVLSEWRRSSRSGATRLRDESELTPSRTINGMLEGI